jgi:diguanylate cyclase (GGDEF)-like protein/PAS domain S-box-containing protein
VVPGRTYRVVVVGNTWGSARNGPDAARQNDGDKLKAGARVADRHPSKSDVMDNEPCTVLLVSDCAADAMLIRKALATSVDEEWTLQQVNRISDGIDRLHRPGIVAVLLDLFLPDSQGIKTFEIVFRAAQRVPILILTSAENSAVARQAMQLGAQDHLLRSHLDTYWLPRILRSVIERHTNEQAASVVTDRAQTTLNSIGDAVLSTDLAGNVTYLNPVAEDMTGWTDAQATGHSVVEVFRIVDGITREAAPNPLQQAIQEDKPVGLTANCVLVRRDGTEYAIEDSAAPIRDAAGKTSGAVIVFRDVTAARAKAQHLAYLAHHDALTNLPNRILLGDRIENAISLARRHGNQGAVLFLDLDGFKQINDSLGHLVGDKLLQSVAQRLLTCVRGSDTVSRQGGDEFVVLLSEIQHARDAGLSAQKMLNALSAPYTIADSDIRISVSIGISLFPEEGQAATPAALIRCADAAMYHAKNEGRANYQFFRQGMQAGARSPQLPEQQAARRAKSKKARAVLPVTHPVRHCAD